MTSIDDERVDRLRSASPAAAALAALVSTALRVEPALLRHARLRLLPGADVSAEADLWNSDLLASATANALSFHPGVAQVLRRDLAREPPATRADALELVATMHRDHHWSVRLEEAVHALDVEGGPDARARQEQLLLAAVRELRQASTSGGGSGDDPVAIARWLLGAYARLAPGTQRADGASAAALAAGFHLDGRVSAPSAGGPDVEAAWLPWLLAAAGEATPARVRVSFAGSSLRVELEGAASGGTTPLPPGMIEVPATTPVTIDVAPVGVIDTNPIRLHLQPGQPVDVPLGSDEVLLTTLDGTQHTARRPGATPAAGYDFGARRAELRPCLARDDVMAWLDGITERDAWWTVVAGPEGIGKSVVVNDAIDALQRREVVVVWHFFGVDPAWDEPVALVASLEAQLRAALPAMEPVADDDGPPGGRLMAVLANAAASVATGGGRRPIVVALDGLRDESADGRSPMWDLPFPSKPPEQVRFLASARRASSVGDWLEDGDPRQTRDLGSEPTDRVCEAMLARSAWELRLAFGLGAGELTQTMDPSRIVLQLLGRIDPEMVDALIDLAGANPGRLARLLTWVLDQPPGTVTLDRIPVSLTALIDGAWARAADIASRAGAPHPDWLGWAVVALPGFTLADYRDMEARSSPSGASVAAPIEEVPDLVRITGGPEPGLRQVAPVDPSVLDAFSRQFGVGAVIAAHAAHARRILPGAVADVSGYRIRSTVHHYLGAGDVHGAAALLLTPVFARWRWTLGGPGELVADIDRTIAAGGGGRTVALQALRRAVDVIAVRAGAVPELVMSLLVSEYRRQGGPPEDLGPTDQPPVVLERIVDAGGHREGWTWAGIEPVAALTAQGDVVVASAGRVFRIEGGRPVPFADVDGRHGVRHLAVSDAGVALAGGDWLVVVGEAQEPTALPAASPVTALMAWEDGFVSGHADGTVAFHVLTPDGGWRRHIATGHIGPVTALGQHQEWLVTGGADGTVRWWTADGNAVRTGRRHRGAVRCLASFGDLLGSGDDTGMVVVWPADGGSDTVVPGHRGAVTALVDAGGSLVSAGADGAVRGWDRSTGSRVFRSDGPAVVAVAVLAGTSPGFVEFVTAEVGGTFRWWPMSGPPELVAWRPLGVATHAILAGRAGSFVAVHDGGVTALELPPSPGDDGPPRWQKALAIGPDGDRVAMGVPDGVVVVSTASGERLEQLTFLGDDRPVALAFAGGDLVRVDGHERLHLRDAELAGVVRVSVDSDATGELTIATAAGEVVNVDAASLSPGVTISMNEPVTALDRRHGSTIFGTAGGAVAILTGVGSTDVSTYEERLPVAVTAVAMTAPFSAVAAGADGGLWMWVLGRDPVRFGHHPGGVTALAASTSGTSGTELIIVSGGTDGLLRVWSVESGLLVGAVAVPGAVEALVAAASRVAVRTADGELWLLQTQPPEQAQPEPPSSSSAS